MADSTKIQWTDKTFNPWRGCTKISPGCANCYAEKLSHRNPTVLGEWGAEGKRAIAAESYWRQPLVWNREAGKAGLRHRVFCLSLGDVFEDRPELESPRQRLFDLILATPNLDWQLLTKRPDVMRDWLIGKAFMGAIGGNAHAWGDGWPNVWLGVSVEDQQRAKERIPMLLSIPAKVHWLSCEPLIGPLDIEDYIHVTHGRNPVKTWPYGHVKWVVVGGESGAKARPFNLEWARSLVTQCHGKAACFVKQFGEQPRIETSAGRMPLKLQDKKGGDPGEWPKDLRVREFPLPVYLAR